MSYTKVDDIVQGIWKSAVGCMLTKINITNAYRAVPVHLVTIYLLVTAWRRKLFIDEPFLTVSGQLQKLMPWPEYIIKQHGVEHLWHYLGNYITVGKSSDFLVNKTSHMSIKMGPCVQEWSEVAKCTLIEFHD